MAAVTGGFIISSASPPLLEPPNTGQQDDLDASIPDTGIALGGDGKTGYPRINVPGVWQGPNPLLVPDTHRPLPTGTALGPKGARFGLYSVVPSTSTGFTTPDTTVVDLADPTTAAGVLAGVSQGSGAYDPTTSRMLVVGNTTTGRAMWVSAAQRCWSRRPWWVTLGAPRHFGLMNGDRENQVVALPGGGFLLVAASDYQPVVAAAAGSAAGLLVAAPTPLIGPDSFEGGMYPYGPTITALARTGDLITVMMRVSTFGIGGYDPHTYLTEFVLRRTQA